jgi:hypothetical protein
MKWKRGIRAELVRKIRIPVLLPSTVPFFSITASPEKHLLSRDLLPKDPKPHRLI